MDPISKPGIYKVSNRAYHQGPGLSSTALKELLKSGAHYRAYLQFPPEQTKEMCLGSAVHSLILEPETFQNEFHVGDFNRRYGKEFERAAEEAGTRILLSKEEFDQAHEMVEAFKLQAKDHPYLNGERANLLEGVKEMAFYWIDPKTGVLCKVKLDNLTPTGIIVDIKTTRDASFDAFQKQALDLKYYLSAAYYLRGVKETIAQVGPNRIVPIAPTHFVCIAIENKKPFAVQTFFFDAQALAMGDRHVDIALDRFSECLATESWAGYPKKMVELGLPNWAYYKFNGVSDR